MTDPATPPGIPQEHAPVFFRPTSSDFASDVPHPWIASTPFLVHKEFNGDARKQNAMKTFVLLWIVSFHGFWFASPTASAAPAPPASREAQWKTVEDAIQKGLPQTAITNLEPIISGALREKAWGEAVKAIARKIVLEGNIQGNKPEEKIARIEMEIARAPREIVPLLETLRATWYWHYFQQNRWRFLQRTATTAPPGKDFTTWDLPRLFTEIDARFAAALAGASALQKIPVATFDAVLPRGSMPDEWRPTLYDFIVHEALAFYSSAEQAASKPEDAFEISSDSPIFGSVENFLEWKPATTDAEAPKLKAIRLHQDLLRFHQKDRNPGALLLADIERLQFGENAAFGETKHARYKAALAGIAEKWADHELAGYASVLRARVIQGEGDLVEARNLAQRVRQQFPASLAARQARNLIGEIEARSASILTERIWNAPWPPIQVHYRNVTNIWFRAVPWDWSAFLDRKRSRPEYLNDAERKELMQKTPALEWSAPLPATADFRERMEELPAPGTLNPGFYFLISSHNAAFDDVDNQVQYSDFWVSDLALVVRPRNGKLEGFVLEANSGEPATGAELNGWFLSNQGDRVAVPATKTDENGFFTFDTNERRGHLIRVRHNGRELASEQEFWAYETPRPEAREQTMFFTDRSLYRPGQIIQYKGITLRVDTGKDDYAALSARKVTIAFLDANQKEFGRAEHVCNDYGSFSGSFTAPRDRLMGQYQIRVVNGGPGQTFFNVEEYKRPKFQVTLDAPKTAARLNEKVSLAGKAESYTGASIDGAAVKWRVEREVRWPWWGWHSWRGAPSQGSQEISHGIARTGADGAFTIDFIAKPDASVAEKDEATFSFSISADVTDGTGETRSAQRSIQLGFIALSATIAADEWQTTDKPVELKIKTTTLDGEAQKAAGSVKIHRLKEPAQVQRAMLGSANYYGRYNNDRANAKPDLSDPNNWELGDIVAEKDFSTDIEGISKLEFPLGPGMFRAMLETRDRFGKKVTGRLPLRVLKPSENKLALRIPHLVAAPEWNAQPGRDFTALWGTGYEQGRAFIEIEHRNRMIQRYWTTVGTTQARIQQAVDESMRGGFTLHITQVRENRAYLDSRRVDVPWSNKELDLKWEHFTSKLLPGQKETWTLEIRSAKSAVTNAERAVAELAATLYDESLDAYLPHSLLQRFNVFRMDHSGASPTFVNAVKGFRHLKGNWRQDSVSAEISYRHFPPDLVQNFTGYQFASKPRGMSSAARGGPAGDAYFMNGSVPSPAVAALGVAQEFAMDTQTRSKSAANRGSDKELGEPSPAPGRPPPDLSQVAPRKNLNETAFFFPQLLSDSNGVVKMQFTMPEALTQWRFLGFAHDAQCRSGFLEGKSVTAKDLMVQPNPPRFLREGDTLEFTAKVSNQTAGRQEGKVRLTFEDAAHAGTMMGSSQPGGLTGLDRLLGNLVPEIPFDIPSRESRSFSWRIKVPDGAPFLTYKVVGSTGGVSDGEEGFLPVLSRRIFVTESLPLPIRGKAGGPVTKKFEFEKLLKSGRSSSLVHQNLTVQMVSNPSWYAVMALPYLMEFPHECTEQTFNRLYANALARSIANGDAKIRRVFDQWKATPAVDSPLEKNQDLKGVMIEETPWVRQANNESQARKNVGILFDANRLDTETALTLAKLAGMQLPDGAWPWFPGGRGNDYITLYITTGFGRLRHLGADIDIQSALKSLGRLDAWMDEHYRKILELPHPEEYVPGSIDALYLYGRSFFLKDKPIGKPHLEAIQFFLRQSRVHWLKVTNRQSQGHLAIALHRFAGDDNKAIALSIMKSIRERSVTTEEMGMFWRETELSWWWYRAPIETQALMIEAFDEVMSDKAAVEECRVWLLKQKQTQDWKTTKATADAVYALLLRGRDFLSSDALVELKLGGVDLAPRSGGNGARSAPPSREPAAGVEAGTGFYEKRFAASDIKPKLGEITVTKRDEGVAWGSIHWQYLEDMSKVTPFEGTPLKLRKSLHIRSNTKKGQVLTPVKGPLNVGDELVVRIELRVDRDMEYIHLKDQRGSGTEPVNVISRFKYQDGLGYYETTRDTASHFFIDYLPKGVYVFEYATRVQHRGAYQTGVAEIQCMYAPEFNSHSESLPLVVR
ncbi:MAG: hypothetical protein QOF48_3125 [Verrucomicrobiota bacterium]